MYRHEPRHPLQSFRFWFLVLTCIAATSAWRLGWLPGTDGETSPSPGEVALSEPSDAQPFSGDAPLPGSDAAVLEGQYEPAVARAGGTVGGLAANAFSPAGESIAPLPGSPFTTQAAGGPPHVASSSAARPSPAPFGPANLEFIPADARPAPPPATSTSATTWPPESQTGAIQQVAAREQAPVDQNAARQRNAFNAEFTRPAPPDVDWAAIDQMIDAGQDVEAHRQLSSIYWERPELREPVRPRIQQTARRIYFQPQPHYLDPCVVAGGDVLEQIAKRYGVSWQYLSKLNRTDPLRIRPGQKLKVMQGPFGAVVDLRRFELTVESYGYYVASFPIGIGKDGTTPVGEFTVQDKLEDPTYYGPDRVIANDDPANPLGEFWIALGDGYGIHGTIDETSIGRAESRGCIRLKNQDIADLYDLLTVGSKVVIRR